MNMKMLVCLYKSHLQTLILKHQTLHKFNYCLTRPIIRSYRTKKLVPKDTLEFTNSFLKNKCGLSGKALINASKYVAFNSCDKRPDSVLELFRTYGFPLSSITRIVTFYPPILLSYADKIIQPKLDYLLSISASQSDVVDIVTRCPNIIKRSLYNHLIPFLNQLKCLTGCYPSVVAFLKCNPFVLGIGSTNSVLLNVKFLVTLGVSHSQILRFLKLYAPAPSTPNDKFRNVVLKLMDMGFDIESSYFLNAFRSLSLIDDSTWKARCVLLKSFGFSDQEIILMFKKLPDVMCYTEKIFTEKIEFFLNKLQWTTFRLSSNPVLLAYSLEKRTIPRCSVLEVLVLKNSTCESYNLCTILQMSESKYIKDFVSVHKEVPEVMDAYKGKLRFDEYTFKQKGQSKLKTV